MKLIAMACSATKSPAPGMVPAIDRYQGPMWQTLRAALCDVKERPQIWFLSARYGFQLATLIIPDYEHLLIDRPATLGNAEGFARSVKASEKVLFAGGKLYRDLMMEAAGHPLTYSATWGSIGWQRNQLRAWIAENCA